MRGVFHISLKMDTHVQQCVSDEMTRGVRFNSRDGHRRPSKTNVNRIGGVILMNKNRHILRGRFNRFTGNGLNLVTRAERLESVEVQPDMAFILPHIIGDGKAPPKFSARVRCEIMHRTKSAARWGHTDFDGREEVVLQQKQLFALTLFVMVASTCSRGVS